MASESHTTEKLVASRQFGQPRSNILRLLSIIPIMAVKTPTSIILHFSSATLAGLYLASNPESILSTPSYGLSVLLRGAEPSHQHEDQNHSQDCGFNDFRQAIPPRIGPLIPLIVSPATFYATSENSIAPTHEDLANRREQNDRDNCHNDYSILTIGHVRLSVECQPQSVRPLNSVQ
jgi:hypothetical protein